jgi:DNA primase small subunit
LISENKSVGKNVSLVKGAFREYYFRYGKLIENPERIEQHEFGYAPFGSGMIRHLSFRNIGDLLAKLVRDVPADVYCSNAYYRFPAYPMQEKQWLGADLIFDIDAKDLHLPCEPSHSYFVCERCKTVFLAKSDVCEFCKSGKLNQTSVPCYKCFTSLKKEVRYLITFLTDELGIDEKYVSIYFSGNNGFHVYVSQASFRPLSAEARSDIASYLTGTSLTTESIGVRKANTSSGGDFVIKIPKSGISYGWRKMIADKLEINQSSVVKLNNIVRRIGGYESFKSELANMAKTLGVRIDPQVTMDVHRIFRMPGTLTSKSGLVKTKCNDLDSFDPLNDSCLLGSNEIEIKIKAPSQISMKLRGQTFKLNKQTMKLPVFAAVYLICKDLAEVPFEHLT